MNDASLTKVLGVLDLEQVDDDTFTGTSVPQPGGRVFGGQVLAQALIAAGRTVPRDRLPHSMHGYFLRPGDVTEPITFVVERMRDGRSFTARRTHALQHGKPILAMNASFQLDQPGIEHAETMPPAPPPDGLPSAGDLLGPVDHPVARFWTDHSAFDLRHVEGSLYFGPAERVGDPPHGQMVWMRPRGSSGDDQLVNRALLAYACDQVMLEPVLRRHGHSWVSPDLSIASLDHAMWWHRPVPGDEWLLFVQSSPSAQGGRALTEAKVYLPDGTLVASMAQEGMFRLRD